MVAIIPAAGKGTRMFSVTGGRPKELLRLGRSTVLDRVIDEAFGADVDEIVVVSSPEKPQIEEHLRERHSGRVVLAFQPESKGLADAVLHAGVEGDALILLADVVYFGGSPAERMANLVFRGGDGCIAVEPVSDDEVSRYGICEVDEGTGQIRRILEKPNLDETDSRWAVAGRYACSVRLLAFLCDEGRTQALSAEDGREPAGELTFTDVLNAAIQEGFDLKAVALQPDQQRVDCGDPEEYSQARWLEWD